MATRTKAKKTDDLIFGIKPYKATKTEKYMSQKQVEHFRSILNAWRDSLINELNRTVHHIQDETENHADPNDRASQETDFTLELRSRDRERKLLKKIDSSLTLLDKSDYGFCESCGEEIGLQRLEARPTAELCIDCKSLAEIREKKIQT